MTASYRSIQWLEQGVVRMLDQRLLPQQTVYNDYTTAEEVAIAIREMVIRGAPAIGAAAAYALALAAHHSAAVSPPPCAKSWPRRPTSCAPPAPRPPTSSTPSTA